MDAALLSFIVPVYNAEGTLESCVNSLLCQQGNDFEVILVDDGSTDQSPALCDRLQAADPRVRVLHQPNGGVSTARNAGIELTQSPWIAFLDSDDLMAPQTMARLRPQLQQDVDTVCFSWNTFSAPDGSDLSDDGLTPSAHVCTPDEVERLRKNAISTRERFQDSALHFKNSRFVSAACFRTRILRDNHLRFDPAIQLSEDSAFRLMYWSYCSTAVCMGDVLYYYRVAGESLSNRYVPGIEAQILHFDQIVRSAVSTRYHDEADYLALYAEAVIVQMHWVFPLYLLHERCPLSEAEKAAEFARFKAEPINREAIAQAEGARLYPPFDQFLKALRIEDDGASYAQCRALYTAKQSHQGRRKRIKQALQSMGLLTLARKLRRVLHRS